MPSVFINLAIAILISARTIVTAVQPQVIRWSDESYGPDGPWSAVTVEIGTPAIPVDLLPGGSWMTNILGVDVCQNAVTCPAEKAGIYDFEASSTFKRIGSTGKLKDNFDENPGSLATITDGDAGWIFDELAIPATEGGAGFMVKLRTQDFSMIVFDRAQSTLPDGTKYPPTIGKLALGSPNWNQTWNHAPVGQFNGTLLTSALVDQGRSPSNSYSMHVGSPTKGIPPSLVMGGYHKDRALGSVSIQPYAFDSLPIDLLDIEIGVGVGASPFTFTRKDGLLAELDSTLSAGQQVTVDATQPYLYLPPTVCKAVAQYLPVTFDAKYGIYFWDQSRPDYKKIVESPAYLGFKFRESGSVTDSIMIKVPFGLLDLTLSSPIISTPKQYFPCFAGQDSWKRWSLGRSFMQAAFVGVKWEDGGGNWFIAQAPGPNTPKTVSPLTIDNTIVSSTTKWEDTWKGFWNVTKLSVEEDGSGDNSTDKSASSIEGAGVTATLGGPSSSSTGGTGGEDRSGSDGKNGADSSSRRDGENGSSPSPSIGAIAGGVVGGVLLFGGVLFAFIFFRRRNSKSPFLKVLPKPEDSNLDYNARNEFKAELDGTREMAEMEGKSYQGRFGQEVNQEWKGNGYVQHGQSLEGAQALGLADIGRGLGTRVVVREMHEEMHEMPAGTTRFEMYAPWSPKGI